MEVDFVVPQGAGKLALIEVKSTKTPLPNMAKSLVKLGTAIKNYQCESVLIHRGRDGTIGPALLPGISAMNLEHLLQILA